MASRTVILPSAEVETEATYLLVWVADSQPQFWAPGAVVAVWYTSEIVVRHCEAASTASETFALMV